MITFEQFLVALNIITALLAAYFGIKSHQRDNKQDNSKEVAVLTTIQVQLDTIKDGISELKTEIKSAKEDINGLREKVAILDQGVKSAHHRLDEHDKRLDNRSDDRK
jgi:peptidoglycan hydrolase CwlO-like protein